MSPADRLYPYRLLLDLPTAHLSGPGRTWLTNQARQTAANGKLGDPILEVGFLPSGFYLRVETDRRAEIPDDLHDCMVKAAELGAFAILFDAGAEPSDLTGDLPVYDEADDDAELPRELLDDLAVGTFTVFALSRHAPNDTPHAPRWPIVYGTESAAQTGFKTVLRDEWTRSPPLHPKSGKPQLFPERETADAIHAALADFHGERWSPFVLTRHTVAPAPRSRMPSDQPLAISPRPKGTTPSAVTPYRNWSLMPDCDAAALTRLVGMSPRAAFGKADVRDAMAARGWTDLADLAHAMPDEILALPKINFASLVALRRDIRSRINDEPLVSGVTPAEFRHLARSPLRGAGLAQGCCGRLEPLGILTLADLARVSEARLDAAGLSKVQIDSCESCLIDHLERSEWPRQRRRKRGVCWAPYEPGYDERPLPPGLHETPIRQTRLGASKLAEAAEAGGLITLGDLITTLPDRHHKPSGLWKPEQVRGLQFHIARQARAMIAGIPGGDDLYRVPFLFRPVPEPDPLFWDLTDDDIAYLDTIAPDRRAPEWDDLPASRQRILFDHGLDTLGLVAETDLAFLFEILRDKVLVCETIQDIRRELIAYDATLSPDA